MRIFHLDHDGDLLVLFIIKVLTFLDRNDALVRDIKAAARILDQSKLQQGIKIVKVSIDSLQRVDHRSRFRIFRNACGVGQNVRGFVHILDMNHDRIEYKECGVDAVPHRND